jgi:phosphotransacetylase
MSTRRFLPLLSACIALTAACGGPQTPTTQLGQTSAAIRAAEAVGAEDTPQAALYLKMAHDHLERAKRLVREDNSRAARYALAQGEADADLALALAREERLRADATAVLNKLKRLQDETR